MNLFSDNILEIRVKNYEHCIRNIVTFSVRFEKTLMFSLYKSILSRMNALDMKLLKLETLTLFDSF